MICTYELGNDLQALLWIRSPISLTRIMGISHFALLRLRLSSHSFYLLWVYNKFAMTFIEHALYGGAVMYKVSPHLFWIGVAVGVLPDIPPLLYAMKKVGIKKGIQHIMFDPLPEDVPEDVYKVYDLTHSFITAFALFLVLFFINKTLSIVAFSYLLHIICDIPFHNSRFSTRFLYPLSNFHVKGFSNRYYRYLHVINISMLAFIYYMLI